MKHKVVTARADNSKRVWLCKGVERERCALCRFFNVGDNRAQ